jgi:hypothetical protein
LTHQALRPHRRWRNVAHQCIQHHLLQPLQQQDIKGEVPSILSESTPAYLALHARVEVDMMIHRCGKNEEKNLTNIFHMVDSFVNDYNSKQDAKLDGTFIAISRNNMKQSWKDPNVTAMADHNWNALNARTSTTMTTSSGDKDHLIKVFECGEVWMDRWYKEESQSTIPEDDYYGSILPSIINFYIATHATIFIGVDKSSWSNDVWTTRYHLGKGSTNYKYTLDQGIVLLSNGGLPLSHISCNKERPHAFTKVTR